MCVREREEGGGERMERGWGQRQRDRDRERETDRQRRTDRQRKMSMPMHCV